MNEFRGPRPEMPITDEDAFVPLETLQKIRKNAGADGYKVVVAKEAAGHIKAPEKPEIILGVDELEELGKASDFEVLSDNPNVVVEGKQKTA